jgi:Disulphide bond corrector protein DsbC
MKSILLIILMNLFTNAPEHVKWKISLAEKAKVGAVTQIHFDAKIEANWHIYSSELAVEGPQATSVEFDKNTAIQLVGSLKPLNAKEKHDEVWDGKIAYFEKTAKLSQTIKVNSKGKIKGTLTGQACSNVDGICVPFKVPFELEI